METFKEIQEKFSQSVASGKNLVDFEVYLDKGDADKSIKAVELLCKQNGWKHQKTVDAKRFTTKATIDVYSHWLTWEDDPKDERAIRLTVVANQKSKNYKDVDLSPAFKTTQSLNSASFKSMYAEQVGNKTDDGVLEIGSDDILASYQADTPGEIETSYLKDVNEFIEISEKKKKEQVKAHFAMVFDNPLQGFPYNEQFGMDKNLTEKPVEREEIAEMTKSKLKIDTKILKDLKKLEKSEKGMNDKEVKWVHDFFKKGVDVVQDGDGEPKHISNQALKKFDPVWGKMDTMVRDSIYSIMRKHSDEAVSAILSPYGA